ncbi:phiSA1p31-related protein [Streptomyces sp. NPDC047981]|uniref:phiSA1p31-related protein n=1 Tax=Streptomyces sp. NPDC047981 TaxID=3154610 RepID=UPI00341F856D
MPSFFEPCNPFEPANEPDATEYGCTCPTPDDQYLLEIDEGSVLLTHKACGKSPRGDWWQDSSSLMQVPVTITSVPYGACDGSEWHGEHRCDCGRVAVVEINDRAVMHSGKPYLIGRDYADREGALWRITDTHDRAGNPLVFLLPEGAGEPALLSEIAEDYGPLTLTPTAEEPTP